MDNCPYCDRPLAAGICPVHMTVDRPQPAQETFVQGMIIMWSGSVATIPAGWALCDGGNGTPNLADRFVVGCGSNAPGVTGGGNTSHNHAVSATSTAATTGVTHTIYSSEGDIFSGISPYLYSDGGHSDPGHSHTINITQYNHDAIPAYYAIAFIMKL